MVLVFTKGSDQNNTACQLTALLVLEAGRGLSALDCPVVVYSLIHCIDVNFHCGVPQLIMIAVTCNNKAWEKCALNVRLVLVFFVIG